MDWTTVDIERLTDLICRACRRGLAGGLMRQVKWTAHRVIIVIACRNCGAESMVVLDASLTPAPLVPPIDVDDVLRAHLLLSRAVRLGDLFAA